MRYFWALTTPGRSIYEDHSTPGVFRFTDHEALFYERPGAFHNVIFKWKPSNNLLFQGRAWAPTPVDALPELELLLGRKLEIRPQ